MTVSLFLRTFYVIWHGASSIKRGLRLSLPLYGGRVSLSLSLMLRPTVSQPVYLGIKHPSGAYDQIFITVTQLRVCWYGALSLTRGRVCRLQLPLALTSALILGSESHRTRDHILLSQIWDFHFCRLLSQGYCGGIRPHLHTRLSESESHCYWRSISLSVLVSSPFRGSWPDICYCLTISVLSLGGRPLWREGGSVFCQSLSAVISQLSVCTVIYI
jgi:hypothetical protein